VQGGYLQVFTQDPTRVSLEQQIAPLPHSLIHARKEIEKTLLDYIVYDRIGYPGGRYRLTTGKPWEDDPGFARLLVLAPPYSGEMSEVFQVDSYNPLQVWWFDDGWLITTTDLHKSIQEYDRRFVEPVTDWEAHGWSRYDFGILAVSEDLRHAEVYIGHSCGMACGTGYHYWLRRSLSGKWWFVLEEHLWDS
jgi:hypothetical protein